MERGIPEGDIHAPCREIVAALQKRIEQLEAANRALEKRLERLQARLNQNSRNSSKPPSSDPPWANRPPKPPSGRSPGGQPGHPGSTRPSVPPDQVSELVVIKPSKCEGCGRRLAGEDPQPIRHQVSDLPPVVIRTIEYVLHQLLCSACGTRTRGELPAGTPEGRFGPRLQAIIAYLSGQAHLSKRLIQTALADLFGVKIGLASIAKAEQAISQAVKPAVEEAHRHIQTQRVIHADETGWTQGRKRAWLWVATTMMVSVFMIHARRNAKAAAALLGTFDGVLVTDRWSAYKSVPLKRRQICWAHLIRDFRGFLDRGREAAKIGRELLAEADQMFALWHRVRDGTLKRASFRSRLSPIRQRVETLLDRGFRCRNRKVSGKCLEILFLRGALWTFARVPGVEPTNNAAERAIRPAVLYRKGCFGTHSEGGSRFVERMLTVTATLRQQGRTVLDFLIRSMEAVRDGKRGPSLLPRRSAQAAA